MEFDNSSEQNYVIPTIGNSLNELKGSQTSGEILFPELLVDQQFEWSFEDELEFTSVSQAIDLSDSYYDYYIENNEYYI